MRLEVRPLGSEAHPDHVLIGTHFRKDPQRRIDPDPQQMVDLAGEHFLIGAVARHDFTYIAGVAKHAENKGQPTIQGHEGAHPFFEVSATFLVRAELPREESRHVDWRGTARHGKAAPQAGKPFVIAKMLADAALRAQIGVDGLDFVEHGVQPGCIHAGMFAQGGQRGALAFEILHDGAPQVGAFRDVEQLEQRGHGYLVVANVFALREEEQTVKQMFDTQKGTDSFVARIFVENHATYNLYRIFYP